HNVGAILNDREYQLDVVVGIVFQIGILHENKIAGGQLKTIAQGRALSFVDFLVQDFEVFAGKEPGKLIDPGGAAVGRAVVDADDLAHNPRQQRRADDAANQLLERRFLVVNGNDDRKFDRRRRGSSLADRQLHHRGPPRRVLMNLKSEI